MPKNMRHRVNVMRPTEATDEYGATKGKAEIVMENWPCSIEKLSGREVETARQTVPTATYRVKGYGDPRKPIGPGCYLLRLPLAANEEEQMRMEIGFVKDVNLNGIELELICGEEIHG